MFRRGSIRGGKLRMARWGDWTMGLRRGRLAEGERGNWLCLFNMMQGVAAHSFGECFMLSFGSIKRIGTRDSV